MSIGEPAAGSEDVDPRELRELLELLQQMSGSERSRKLRLG
jgi:hypothetical protein